MSPNPVGMMRTSGGVSRSVLRMFQIALGMSLTLVRMSRITVRMMYSAEGMGRTSELLRQKAAEWV